MDDAPHLPSRRSGGRDARRAMRAAPLAEDMRPVRPGLAGGRYRPLDDADILRIHRAALDLLEQVGLADAPPSGVAILTESRLRCRTSAAGCASRARWWRTRWPAPGGISCCTGRTRGTTWSRGAAASISAPRAPR